jgi:formylmethanofuran dehydrogenase subunit E
MVYTSGMSGFEDCVRFHGHACPGLALGYRVAKFALGRLGERARDEELVAIVENDSCAVDAIQVITGCTFGKGNLVFRDYGKQVYTFLTRPSGQALRVVIDWNAPPETDAERSAWEAYRLGERSEAIEKVVHDAKSRKIRSILDAPDEEVLIATELASGAVALPSPARIFASLRCASCGEKVMESRARLREGRTVCIPCFERRGHDR